MSGKESVIELIVDNKNTVLSGTASRAVQSVVGAHNSTTVVNRRMAAGWSSAQAQGALNLSSRMLYNPTGGYIDFFLAALIVHSGQIAIVFTMAQVRSQSSPRNNVPCADVRRLHDSVFAVRGRVGQYPAESDNLAAVLYHAVGFVQRSDLAAHVNGQFQPVPVVHYADWLFCRQPAQSARQRFGGGLAIRFSDDAFAWRNIFCVGIYWSETLCWNC